MEITKAADNSSLLKLLQPELFTRGFHKTEMSLPAHILNEVREENWEGLNESFLKLTSSEGDLHQFLRSFHEFNTIEFIISIRDSNNEWEEDGIWHDDGSRVFAFSLSLTEENVEGGKLGFRKKNSEEIEIIPTPFYGGMILFLTGIHGYEHKIHRVEKGRRIIIAGWCS